MQATPWRHCRHCGRTFQTREELFDLYVAYALVINPDATINETDPLEFCAACGEDFDRQQG